MKKILAVLLFITAQLAVADCKAPDATVALSTEPISCRAIKAPYPYTGEFLEVAVRILSTSVNCAQGKCPVAEYTARRIQSQSVVFITTPLSCAAAMSHHPLNVNVIFQCCDTLPGEVTCSPKGPLVELKK
jgi:hypothetical protein